jgi:protein-disulfide isomerase
VAQNQDIFWPVNDLLYSEARTKKINITNIAKKTGLNIKNLQKKVNEKKNISILANDIRTGIKLGITSTPSYLIDGEIYEGTIPNEILKSIQD